MQPVGKLNQGWRRVKFAQLAECVNDRVDDPLQAGVDRYVGLEHLDPGSLTIRRWGTPDQVESTKLRFQPGDIIFGKRRAYQRKLVVAHFEGICSAHAMVLRARPSAVLPEFLPFLMQSDTFMERAQAISVGSLSPTINWKSLAAEEFALPPQEQQQRTSGALRAVVDHLDSLYLAREQARLAFKVHVLHFIRQAPAPHGRVESAMGQIPRGWRVAKVGEVGAVQLGQKREPKVHEGSNLRQYLRVANVFDGRFELSDVLEMHFPEKDIEKYELQKGDILLNEGQSADLVGRSCIWNEELPGACFQMTLLRFRPRAEVLPQFAHLYFRYCLYGGIFERTAVQTTSMAHLTAARFSQMPFPVPPLKEQESLVETVGKYEAASRLLEQRHGDCTQLLRASIGHLVAGEGIA